MRYTQAKWSKGDSNEDLISEKDTTEVDIDTDLPDELSRNKLNLPDLSEPEIAKHYLRLSQMSYGVDSGPYPLGSCTMKYNPRFTEDLAAHPQAQIHPDTPSEAKQGVLRIQHRLQDILASIGGMDSVSLQPPAGAAGEYTGILIAKAYHRENGGEKRDEVIIPDSAHGTNFASAAMAGYDVVEIPSSDDGRVDIEALEEVVGSETALFMMTNPNTLGLFESNIQEIAEMIHSAGGLLYYDGANLNAMLGKARPGDMGFDVMHFNLHKTFATPHGGGGPGAGPVGVKEHLSKYLPYPVVEKDSDIYRGVKPGSSIGKTHGFHGNWLALLKAYAYIKRLGDEGLMDTSEKAVLNANYLASQIEYNVPYTPFHHEFVASAGDQDAIDVAKRMLDHGVHPPTTKWPGIVSEALMTEPTEAEGVDSLDVLADAFNEVRKESDETLESAPSHTAVRRIDQANAARNPRLSWQDLE